jgi:carboxylesterase type B
MRRSEWLTRGYQIFASLNYRVNILGFLYGDDVAAEHTGNFGLLDQVSDATNR